LGVPERAMVLEEQSRNTRENARFSVALLRERGIGSMVLVTSALHMRRALGLFAAEGMQVFPAATDHEARRPAAWQ
ncbi:MAG: YdcF family protein, partial [Lamprocystis purpurea]|nr:YdcF family protein [Lamprocystis purpurea]